MEKCDAISSFHLIYDEIENYNITYWSKLLFWLSLTFGSICGLLCYQMVFAQIDNLLVKFAYFWAIIMFMSNLLMILHLTSSLTLLAHQSYKIANNLLVRSRKVELSHNIRIKVISLFSIKFIIVNH